MKAEIRPPLGIRKNWGLRGSAGGRIGGLWGPCEMSIWSGNRRSSPSSDIVDINIFEEIITVHQTTDMVSIQLGARNMSCFNILTRRVQYKQYSVKRTDKNWTKGCGSTHNKAQQIATAMQHEYEKYKEQCWGIMKIDRRVQKLLTVKTRGKKPLIFSIGFNVSGQRISENFAALEFETNSVCREGFIFLPCNN